MYKFLFENDFNNKIITARDKIKLSKDRMYQSKADINLLQDENAYLLS